MRHHGRGVREHFAAVDVVGMVVAVDEIAHSLIEPRAQLVFEPVRRVRVDRVGRDDARRGHRENGEVEIVAEAIDFARDLHDLAHRGLGLRLCDDRRGKRCSTGKRARTPEQIAAWKRFGCEDRIVVAAARALRVVGIGGVAAGEAGHGTSSGTGRAAPSVQKSRTWSNTIV